MLLLHHFVGLVIWRPIFTSFGKQQQQQSSCSRFLRFVGCGDMQFFPFFLSFFLSFFVFSYAEKPSVLLVRFWARKCKKLEFGKWSSSAFYLDTFGAWKKFKDPILRSCSIVWDLLFLDLVLPSLLLLLAPSSLKPFFRPLVEYLLRDVEADRICIILFLGF